MTTRHSIHYVSSEPPPEPKKLPIWWNSDVHKHHVPSRWPFYEWKCRVCKNTFIPESFDPSCVTPCPGKGGSVVFGDGWVSVTTIQQKDKGNILKRFAAFMLGIPYTGKEEDVNDNKL